MQKHCKKKTALSADLNWDGTEISSALLRTIPSTVYMFNDSLLGYIHAMRGAVAQQIEQVFCQSLHPLVCMSN